LPQTENYKNIFDTLLGWDASAKSKNKNKLKTTPTQSFSYFWNAHDS